MTTQHTITQLHAQGHTIQEIADQLGITTRKARYWADPEHRQRNLEQSRRYKHNLAGTCIDCGTTTHYNGHGRPTSERCPECATNHQRTWTTEEIINAIHIWANEHHGQPPTAVHWNPPHAIAAGHPEYADAFNNDPRWPHASVVQRYFGSWANAIEAAGYPRPNVGHKNWRNHTHH